MFRTSTVEADDFRALTGVARTVASVVASGVVVPAAARTVEFAAD